MVISFISNSLFTGESNSPFDQLSVSSYGYFIYEEVYYQETKLINFVSNAYKNGELTRIIADLSGCFQVVIADGKTKECLIIQDRWGTYPVFYQQTNGKLLISDDCKQFLNDSKQSINIQASAEMISFGHVMGDKTMLDGVYEFSPRHWHKIAYHENGVQIESHEYWQLAYQFKPANFQNKSKEFVAIWQHKMNIFGEAIKSSGKSCLVPLSGGLDSRLLAEAIDRQDIPQVNLTFGAGIESREIDIAGKISRSLKNGLGQYVLYLTEANYLNLIQHSPVTHRITTGHFAEKVLWYAHLMRHECDYLLSGHSGDFMAGSHLKSRMKRWKQVDEVVEYIVKFKGTPMGRHLYFTDKNFKELIYNSLSEIIARDNNLMNSFMKWDLEERQRRFILRSVIAEKPRELPTMLMPFFDYELFDFFSVLPFEFLLNTKLYRHSMVNHIYKNKSEFAKLPANGQPVYPLVHGVTREYWMKLMDYLNFGKKKTLNYSPSFNWEKYTSDYEYPSDMPREWLLPQFLESNSRMLYSISEFTKSFNTLQNR